MTKHWQTWAAKASVAAAALSMAGAAAAFPVQETGTVALTTAALDALNAAGITATAVAPSSVNGGVWSTQVPLTSADLAGGALISGVLSGGVTLQSTPNFTNTGGSLTITSLRVDVGSSTVFANVSGANGLPSNTDLALFNIASVQANEVHPLNFSGPWVNFQATLTLTDDGLDAVSQALGLNSTGQGIFSAASPFANLSIGAPVPEPSTWALASMGLLATAAIARRRRLPSAKAH